MRIPRLRTLVGFTMTMVAVFTTTLRAQSDQSETLPPVVDFTAFQAASQPGAAGPAIGLTGATTGLPEPQTEAPPLQRPLAAAPSQLGPHPYAVPPQAMMGVHPAYASAPQGYPAAIPAALPAGQIPMGAMPMGAMPGGMGQMPMGAMPPPGMYGGMPGGLMPAMYGEGAPSYPPQGYSDQGGGGACPYCGGQGCENCMGYDGGYGGGMIDPYHDGVFGGFFRRLLPYSEGGRCAPRWYDITADAMFLTREDVGERVEFTSFTRVILGGTVVLSTDNLDYEHEPGLRLTGSIMLLPATNVEFTYFGLFDWDTAATVIDPTEQLFSVYSDFGENPLLTVDPVDQSAQQSIRASNTIDNFEINLRKRWQGPNCRLQGSWLFGARYVYLVDDLNYLTVGRTDPLTAASVGTLDTLVRARNSAVTLQVGGDLWANVVPGISVGADIKAGVGGVRAKYNTSIVLDTPGADNSSLEEDHNNDIVGIGEASVMFIWRVNPNWTVRGGFNAVYMDGVALAFDNFNTELPFTGARTVQPIDDNGKVFYHGAFAGLEWMW